MRRSFAQPPRARCALIEAPAAADDPGQGLRNDPAQIRSEYKRRAATGAAVAALLQRRSAAGAEPDIGAATLQSVSVTFCTMLAGNLLVIYRHGALRPIGAIRPRTRIDR